MKSEEECKKWRKLVKQFEASNQDRKEWCEEREISSHTFGYWFSRYGANSQSKLREIEPVNKTAKMAIKNETLSTINWVEVQLPEEGTQKNISSEKSIPVRIGKAEILLSVGFDKNLFKDIAKILGEIC